MSHSDLIDPLDLSEVEAHLRTAFHATADDLRVSRSPAALATAVRADARKRQLRVAAPLLSAASVAAVGLVIASWPSSPREGIAPASGGSVPVATSEASATATTGDVVPIDVGSAHYLVELDPASLGIATNATLTVRAGLVPPASAVPAGSDDNVRVEPADASGTIVVWRRSPSDPQMWIALEGKGIEVDQLLAFARRILVRAPAPVGSTVTCPPDGCG